MDPFNAMRENEKGLLKLMLLQPPTVPEDTCGEATIRIKLNMPNLASPGAAYRSIWTHLCGFNGLTDAFEIKKGGDVCSW